MADPSHLALRGEDLTACRGEAFPFPFLSRGADWWWWWGAVTAALLFLLAPVDWGSPTLCTHREMETPWPEGKGLSHSQHCRWLYTFLFHNRLKYVSSSWSKKMPEIGENYKNSSSSTPEDTSSLQS